MNQVCYKKELDELINNKQYMISNHIKQELLLPIINSQLISAIKNPSIKSYFNKINFFPEKNIKLDQIPFIPVNMFKEFDLSTCEKDEIIKIVHSSSTTSLIPSSIPINKSTSLRQSKALYSILKTILGKRRRPFVVLDTPSVNTFQNHLSARGAAIRGLSFFSKGIYYMMKSEKGDKLIVEEDNLNFVIKELHDSDVFIFGFTYIIWSVFIPFILKLKIRIQFKKVIILHSGGWKKLNDQRVTKQEFNKKLESIIESESLEIIDFYGMAEQMGVIFPDCKYLNKHVPDFAEIIIRDPLSLKECSIGQSGLIEIISALSDSYYSQAILTDDLGIMLGVDNCPCGKKGKYFKLLSRVEQIEIRGCGDTYASKEYE